MTYSELKSEIFNLNWESQLSYTENPLIIPQAVNRAISTIITEVRPIVKRVKLTHFPLENASIPQYAKEKAVYYSKNNRLEFKAVFGKSYTFECSGKGKAIITDGDGMRELELESDCYKLYRGFLNGETLIAFKGDYSLAIKNFAIYSELISNNPADIPPYSINAEYDLNAATNGLFRGIYGKISVFYGDGRGKTVLKNYSIDEENILAVPEENPFELTVCYKSGFKPFDADTDDDREIPLDSVTAPLLPLLASYYVWLDDEKARAQEYYNQYENRRIAILQQQRTGSAVCEGGVL